MSDKQLFGKVHAHKAKRADTSECQTYEELEAELLRNEALGELPRDKLRFGVGQKPTFNHPEQMAIALEEYFNNTKPEEWTISGIALSVGLTYAGLTVYDKKNKEYYELLERAKLLVHNSYELGLRKNGKAGDIFALKNFGWKDKQEIENTHTIVQMPTIKQTTEDGEQTDLTFDVGQTLEHKE